MEQVPWSRAPRSITSGWRGGRRVAADVLDARLGLLRRRKLAALIEAFRPDLVHCWMRRAASLVPKLDVPVIGWFGGYYEPANFPRCSHFVGVTPAIVEHMVARGVPTARAHYVPTFPTIEAAAPVARAASHARRCNGAAHPVAAAREEGARHPAAGVGRAAGMPGLDRRRRPARSRLKALAARLGVADRVRFLGWRNDRGALLTPPTSACCPRAGSPSAPCMLEAWAAGTPLVAAASQGPSALIEDGGNGLLVPVDDAPALAAAIRRLMADPGLRAHLIDRGRADYQQGFTREAVTERMLALYRQLIAETRRAERGMREGADERGTGADRQRRHRHRRAAGDRRRDPVGPHQGQEHRPHRRPSDRHRHPAEGGAHRPRRGARDRRPP